MTRTGRRWGVLVGALGVCAAAEAMASSAAPAISVDRVVVRVAGWSIGYSNALGGCLAAAQYKNGVTVWMGFGAAADHAFLAFTNPAWRMFEPGRSYDISLQVRDGKKWKSVFAGFEHDGDKGVFTGALKDRSLYDLTEAGGVDLKLGKETITTLSLVGSSDAFAAAERCQKDKQSEGSEANRGTWEPVIPPPIGSVNQAELLKTERLAQARRAANAALKDAAEFVKANGDDPKVFDHVDRITDVRTSLQSTEPAVVEGSTAQLIAALNADPIYVAHTARRKFEIEQDNKRYLAAALATLKTQADFLGRAVKNDPMSDHTADLIGLKKQAEAVIESPDLEPAKTVMGLIDVAIDQDGLRASYKLVQPTPETLSSDAAGAKPPEAIPASGSASP